MPTMSLNNTLNLQGPTKDQERIMSGMHPVDARLSRLKDEILPLAPYILSTPTSLRSEHLKAYYPQNSISWRKYSPFRKGEEELQYLTFKDRTGDPDVHGMSSRSGWDDGKGRIAGPEEPPNRTSSDSTPRQGQPPRKKISLAEYKNREKNKTTPIATNASGPKPIRSEPSVQNNSIESATVSMVGKPQQTEQKGQKRSADAMIETQNIQSDQNAPKSPPTKKARTSPKPNTTILKTANKEPNAKPNAKPGHAYSIATSHQAPAREKEGANNTLPTNDDRRNRQISNKPQRPGGPIKPRIPPMLSPLSSERPMKSRIPPMLSPLSASVEDEIAKMTATIQTSTPKTIPPKSSQSSPSVKPSQANRLSKPAPGRKAQSPANDKPPISTKQSKTNASSKGSQHENDAAVTPRSISKDPSSKDIVTPKSSANAPAKGSIVTSIPTPKTTPPDVHKRMRLRICLKIKKKANRKPLMQYLNMKPTLGRNSLFPNRPIEHKQPSPIAFTETKPRSSGQPGQSIPKQTQSKRSDGPKTGEKRSRTHLPSDEHDLESEPSSKRKPSGWIPQSHKPTTPKPPPTSTPKQLPTSTPKQPPTNTPKQPPTSSPALSHLGSSQKRPTSTPNTKMDGNAMTRSGSGQGTVQTPQQPLTNGTPSAPDTNRLQRSRPSSGRPKSDDMRKEGAEYVTMAVDLKHDADKYLKKEDMTDSDRQKGLVLGVESVLCFMLAFTFYDSVRAYSDPKSWESILPYLVSELRREARNYEQLAGLLFQIEAIIRDTISQSAVFHLRKLEMELSGSPNADTRREVKATETMLTTNFMEAQEAWREGWMLLSNAEIAQKYSATWAKRDIRRRAYGKDGDIIKRGDYTRGYNLPLNNLTSGLEAVNFGLSILTEWSQEAGVEWEPKLVL